MNDFKVYKTIHFSDAWAEQITLMHQKQWNTNKGSYMYYNVKNMNNDSKHNFYILGVLNDKVIASCCVESYIDYESAEQIEKKELSNEKIYNALNIVTIYTNDHIGKEQLKEINNALGNESVDLLDAKIMRILLNCIKVIDKHTVEF